MYSVSLRVCVWLLTEAGFEYRLLLFFVVLFLFADSFSVAFLIFFFLDILILCYIDTKIETIGSSLCDCNQ